MLLNVQSQAGDTGGQRSTLQNLTAFLTLSKAEEKGFDPSKYELTEEQAGQLASVFAKYDTNDDMVLELSEIQRLLYALTLAANLLASLQSCVSGVQVRAYCSSNLHWCFRALLEVHHMLRFSP